MKTGKLGRGRISAELQQLFGDVEAEAHNLQALSGAGAEHSHPGLCEEHWTEVRQSALQVRNFNQQLHNQVMAYIKQLKQLDDHLTWLQGAWFTIWVVTVLVFATVLWVRT